MPLLLYWKLPKSGKSFDKKESKYVRCKLPQEKAGMGCADDRIRPIAVIDGRSRNGRLFPVQDQDQ